MEDPPQGAGCEDVAGMGKVLPTLDHLDVERARELVDPLGICLAGDHASAHALQPRREQGADRAQPLHDDGSTRPIDLPVEGGERGLDPLEDPLRRAGRELARAPGTGIRHVGGLRMHPGELPRARVDVRPRVEAPGEALDRAADGAIRRLQVEPLLLEQDDLSSSCRQLEQGALPAHRAREAQGVVEGRVLGLVGPAPDAAEGRPGVGVVERDQGPRAGGRVRECHDLLEPLAGHGVEELQRHACSLSSGRTRSSRPHGMREGAAGRRRSSLSVSAAGPREAGRPS